MRSARTCKRCTNKPSLRGFFFFVFAYHCHVLIHAHSRNCWHLRHSFNCVLPDFGWQVWTDPSLLSMPLCLYFNTAFLSLLFFNTLSGKELQGHSSIYVIPNCTGKTQLNVVPKPCNHAAYERDSPSKSTLWKHPWWAQNCFHWWRRTRETIVVPLVVLSELRGNQSDFCPALRLTGRAYGTRLPGYLCMPKRVCQECGHGRWPLCISK